MNNSTPCYLNTLRLIAVILPQMTLLYFIAGSRDMLWGFNQTSDGFTTLLVLLAVSPLLCLAWMIVEAWYSIKHYHQKKLPVLIIWPLLAMLFLVEALAVDLFIIGHFRM